MIRCRLLSALHVVVDWAVVNCWASKFVCGRGCMMWQCGCRVWLSGGCCGLWVARDVRGGGCCVWVTWWQAIVEVVVVG